MGERSGSSLDPSHHLNLTKKRMLHIYGARLKPLRRSRQANGYHAEHGSWGKYKVNNSVLK